MLSNVSIMIHPEPSVKTEEYGRGFKADHEIVTVSASYGGREFFSVLCPLSTASTYVDHANFIAPFVAAATDRAHAAWIAQQDHAQTSRDVDDDERLPDSDGALS